jgi:hypothetical protein
MLLLRRSRRVFCRIGRGVGEGEQSDSCGADDYSRSRGPTTESSGWTMPEGLGDVGRGERKHVTISVPSVGRRWTKRVLFGPIAHAKPIWFRPIERTRLLKNTVR